MAAILLNGLVGQEWDWKFWVALNGVLLLRMATDSLYAYHDAKQFP